MKKYIQIMDDFFPVDEIFWKNEKQIKTHKI
jgi:hypothetical protein